MPPLSDYDEDELLYIDSPSGVQGVKEIDWALMMAGPAPPSPSVQPNHLLLEKAMEEAGPSPEKCPPPPPLPPCPKQADKASTSAGRKFKYKVKD